MANSVIKQMPQIFFSGGMSKMTVNYIATHSATGDHTVDIAVGKSTGDSWDLIFGDTGIALYKNGVKQWQK